MHKPQWRTLKGEAIPDALLGWDVGLEERVPETIETISVPVNFFLSERIDIGVSLRSLLGLGAWRKNYGMWVPERSRALLLTRFVHIPYFCANVDYSKTTGNRIISLKFHGKIMLFCMNLIFFCDRTNPVRENHPVASSTIVDNSWKPIVGYEIQIDRKAV